MEPSQPRKSNLQVFAETILALAERDPAIVVVTGDSRGSGGLTAFGKALPGQIVEVGIAEQNLIGVSAGLASTGKKVFAVSPASFQTARSLEQIKNDVAYSNHSVKLVGISAGVSYGALGSTHHSLHDFAALLAINNLDIVVPADNFEARQAVIAAAAHPRPLYLRLGKKPARDLSQAGADFQIGKANWVREGFEVVFVATGEAVAPCAGASDILTGRGIRAGVLSMHSLRPFDAAALLSAAGRAGAIITVEEHSTHGGLGSVCAALLLQARHCLPFRIMGIPDEHTITGSQEEILSHYGMSAAGLAQAACALLERGS